MPVINALCLLLLHGPLAVFVRPPSAACMLPILAVCYLLLLPVIILRPCSLFPVFCCLDSLSPLQLIVQSPLLGLNLPPAVVLGGSEDDS